MKFTSKPEQTTLHVINHTHWDREWFVPYTFSSKWIPRLIRNLDKMVQKNPDYQYLLDGQTGVIEDLKNTDPESYHLAHKLIHNHNLLVGPYYSQIEARMPGPESLVRNIRIGSDMTHALGGSTEFSGWAVDMFGHTSQSPQIHALFGIKDIYLWRGPSQLEPFFTWKGADGTKVQAIFLFAGGYRNFYKVTSKAQLALPRLLHEVKKLRPYYKAGHIPVFDGFDLDYEPGDAASYFQEHHLKKLERQGITVVNSSPNDFAKTVRKIDRHLPEVSGELISGKYSSVFPGVLSNRSYSKIAADHCERFLYRYAEPLALLLPVDEYPDTKFEDQCKLILQNLVHDVISGCSIDQVHDIAEHRAIEVDATLRSEIANTLRRASGHLQNGTYAFTPATGKNRQHVEHAGKLYTVQSQGIGIFPIAKEKAVIKVSRTVESFAWKNKHYKALLQSDGTIKLNNGVFGQFVLRDEAGDTYWDEPRGEVSEIKVAGKLVVEQETDTWAKVSYNAQFTAADRTVSAKIVITFDDSALLKWQITLLTSGTGYSVLFRQNYKQKLSKLHVGMPFDNVERPFVDTNLLDAKLSPELAAVLNESSQRDLVQTFTFPFHDYISPVGSNSKVHLLAKGLRAYQTEGSGTIDIVLSRPVDWLMKPSVHHFHSGDAGPKYYVPDARSQREVTIDCALLIDTKGPEDIAFHQAVDHYMHPPLIFTVESSHGDKSKLPIFDEHVLVSSLHVYNGKRLARLYNPTHHDILLKHRSSKVDRHGHATNDIGVIGPKRIETVAISVQALSSTQHSVPKLKPLHWLPYPVRPDNSKPDKAGIAHLHALRNDLQHKLDEIQEKLQSYNSNEHVPSSLQHRYYVIARELMEINLSLAWNNNADQNVDPLHVDPKLYKLATEYNDLRIMRRMYDYIIGIDTRGSAVALPKKLFAKLPKKTR